MAMIGISNLLDQTQYVSGSSIEQQAYKGIDKGGSKAPLML